MGYYHELRDSLHTWYHQSTGVRNLRKLIEENEYRDSTYEPRSKYQIDRYECWKISTYMLCLPMGALAAYNGYTLANQQFSKVSELTIYESRVSMWRVRSNFRWMGAMGYSFPVMIRTFTFVAFLLGVPALAGVYCNDTDHVSHYAVSSGVGAVLVSLMTTSSHYRGLRQKIVAAGLGMLPGLCAGVLFSQAQKRDVYPFYDSYVERWKRVDPMWAEFVEKQQDDALVVAGSTDLFSSDEQNSVDLVSSAEQNSTDLVSAAEQKSVDLVEPDKPSINSDVGLLNKQSESEDCIESAVVEEKS